MTSGMVKTVEMQQWITRSERLKLWAQKVELGVQRLSGGRVTKVALRYSPIPVERLISLKQGDAHSSD